jgi:hypothetical protein
MVDIDVLSNVSLTKYPANIIWHGNRFHAVENGPDESDP